MASQYDGLYQGARIYILFSERVGIDYTVKKKMYLTD